MTANNRVFSRIMTTAVHNISACSQHPRQKMKQLAKKFHIDLTEEQIQNAQVPNTIQSMTAFIWMANYFRAFGIQHDDGSVVLSTDQKKIVWQSYTNECHLSHCPAVVYSTFTELWITLFPKEHVRGFVHEMGNCKMCALLIDVLRVAPSNTEREWIHVLRETHRAAHMIKKIPYHEERLKSKANPQSLLCFAWDGMDTAKTKFPWEARLYQFRNPLQHHVLGLINHGFNRQHFLQTFDNIGAGCNVAIQLFTEPSEWSRYLSLRIDGGSENIARALLVICELLVS
jgi:hypothetical protein